MLINQVKKDFDRVIQYSQKIDEPKTKELFDDWYKAKKSFIDAFGGKLIYEYPETVSFELNQEEKEKHINDFIEYCNYTCHNDELADFILNNKDGFFKNLVVNGNNIIPKGMKLLKSFKFFEKNKDILAELQSAASMAIQKNKIEGTFCLSVHPLDFLSASENTHNWRSCHALDGDFRAGNLSYMVDSCTVMCYLKSNEDTILPHFPEDVKWNNKKWRMWLYFSDNKDMLFAGRQYPFFALGALDLIKNKVLASEDLDFPHNWTDWDDKKIESWNDFKLNDKYLPVGDHLIGIHELVIDNPGALHYNDLLYSTCYDPYYSERKYEPKEETFFWNNLSKKPITKMTSRFRLGGKVKCLWCGKDNIQESQVMMCPNCELQYGTELTDDICECDCCGRRVYVDESVWLDYLGVWVCDDCAGTEVAYCDGCDQAFYRKDLEWDEERQGNYCQYCI